MRHTITVLLALGLATSGCTGTTRSGSVPQATASPPASAVPTGPIPTQSPDGTAVPVLDLGTGPGNLGGAAVSTRYEVRADPKDVAAVEVLRRSDRKIIMRHRPADEKSFVTTFAGLAGNHLVLLDEDVNSDSTPDIGFIYNLATGAQTSLTSIHSAPRPSPLGAQGVVYPDGDWYYSAQTSGRASNCVGELNLNTLRGRLVQCARTRSAIWYVHASQTAVTWTVLAGGSLSGCRSVYGVRNGGVAAIGPIKDCHIFDAATLDGWQLWSDQSYPPEPAIPLTASNQTDKISLGNLHPQSLVVCGGYAYWRTSLSGSQGNDDSVVRWRPGDEQAQPVLTLHNTGTTDDGVIWPKGCNDDVLTITVTRYHAADPKATVQVYAVPPSPGN